MLSLFILVPVFLLIFSSLGIIILQRVRPSVGYAWLWATLASFFVVGFIVFLRWRLPQELTINQGGPFGSSALILSFLLDHVSWPYAFSFAVLLVAVLLTDSARLQSDAGPTPWVLSLLITGLGFLAILSGKPITLVLSWTAIDLVELVGVFSTRQGRWLSQPVIIIFAVRVTGTLLVLAAMITGSALGFDFTLNPIPSELAVYMLMAAGLRLGVLPLNLPFIRDVYTWRGLGNLLRLVGPASSLVVLGRMPEMAVPAGLQPWLLFFLGMAALYGSVMWLAETPALSGRPYWVIALAALAVASVTRGDPQSSVAWGTAMLLSGSVLFLYSAQNRNIMWIPLVAALGVSGLPFTPAAAGWTGIITPKFDGYNLVFMVSVLFLCLGFTRRALAPREELYRMERWIHTVFPVGLLVLILAQWSMLAFRWRQMLTPGVWWASVPVVGLAVLGTILPLLRPSLFTTEGLRASWLVAVLERLGSGLAVILRLNWLYSFFGWIYSLVQNLVQLIIDILEGDGGILWAMVMLAMVISLLFSGGNP